MAGVPVVLPDGTTGTVDAADVPAAIGESGRVVAPEEHAQDQAEIAKAAQPLRFGDPKAGLAGFHAFERGAFEAFGIPLDKGILGVAELFGGDSGRESTRKYLKSLDDENPVATGISGFVGNVGGSVAAAELTGGAAKLGALKGGTGLAARAAYGGAENVLQSTTRDFNEAALGNTRMNGEKLVAAAPGRFLMGAAFAGGTELAFKGVSAGVGAVRGAAVPALEEGASRALGREVGATDTLAAGERIRGLSREAGHGEIPGSRSTLADILGGEQATQRAASAAEHESIVDALAGRQAGEAAGLSARQEAARKASHVAGEARVGEVARAGEEGVMDALRAGAERTERTGLEAGARTAEARAGVEAADRAGAEGVLDAAARGGARVEAAELGAAARSQGAHGEAFRANMDAAAAAKRAGNTALHDELAASWHAGEKVVEHYNVLRETLAHEHANAMASVEAIAAEREANSRLLAETLEEVKASRKGKDLLEDIVQVDKRQHIPIEAIEKQPVWEPAKMAALAKDPVAAAKPVRLTLGDDGVTWVITDGIHRIARAREAGATAIDAITTTFVPKAHVPPAMSRGPTKAELIAHAKGQGPKPAPPTGKLGYAARAAALEDAAVVAGRGEDMTRLRKLGEQLDAAHKNAVEHAASIVKAGTDLEKQAVKDITAAGVSADARVAAFQKTTGKEANAKGSMADIAMGRARSVEAEGRAGVEAARKTGEKEVSVAEKKASDHLEKAKTRLSSVEAEGASAVEAARKVGEKEAGVAERRAAKRTEAAREEVKNARAEWESIAAKDRKMLGHEHAKEAKKIEGKGPSTKTDVDPLIAGMKRTENAPASPMVSPMAGLAAVGSILHGNPWGAAAALASSFAAGRARNAGNIASAKIMRGLSEQIARVDNAIRSGTSLILGRTAARGATELAELRGREEEKTPKLPPFEKIVEDLYAAEGNPSLLERRVEATLGPVAKDAPETYTATLAASQRAHTFLLNILPRPQRDPFNLTPQLDMGSVDETSKYEFMQAVKTIANPLGIYKDVLDKTVTEEQAAAIEEVFPDLYAQMRGEVDRQKLDLEEPIEYDRAIHIGTLLGIVTDEVLEPEFQRTLVANYKDKAAQGEPVGSKAQGGESKTSKAMMSASESVEGGTP